MDFNKIEDAVLKKAMDTFRQSAVNFFGIDAKIVAPEETEIKNIDIKTNYTDYLFYIEDADIKVKCLSMLYALHEKFGDENSKRRLKEAKQLIIV